MQILRKLYSVYPGLADCMPLLQTPFKLDLESMRAYFNHISTDSSFTMNFNKQQAPYLP